MQKTRMKKAWMGEKVYFSVRDLLWKWGKQSEGQEGYFSVISLYFLVGWVSGFTPRETAVPYFVLSFISLSRFALSLINLSLFSSPRLAQFPGFFFKVLAQDFSIEMSGVGSNKDFCVAAGFFYTFLITLFLYWKCLRRICIYCSPLFYLSNQSRLKTHNLYLLLSWWDVKVSFYSLGFFSGNTASRCSVTLNKQHAGLLSDSKFPSIHRPG